MAAQPPEVRWHEPEGGGASSQVRWHEPEGGGASSQDAVARGEVASQPRVVRWSVPEAEGAPGERPPPERDSVLSSGALSAAALSSGAHSVAGASNAGVMSLSALSLMFLSSRRSNDSSHLGSPRSSVSRTTSGSDMRAKARSTYSSPKWARLKSLQHRVRKYGAEGSQDPQKSRTWIQSAQADLFFAAAIMVYSFMLGLDVEIRLRTRGEPESVPPVMAFGLLAFRCLLLLVFTVELLLRMRAWRFRFILSIDGAFDIFLVVTSWFDILVTVLDLPLSSQVDAAMNFCRLLRLVRIFRIFTIVPALRLICRGLMDTVVSCFWAVTLLLLLAYVGSLLCTDTLGEDPDESLHELFGSVFLSVLTHVKLALMEAWPDIAEPMLVNSRLWAPYLAVFMLVCNMALLNVVTGLICEKVMELAHRKPAPTYEEVAEEHREQRAHIGRLWDMADTNHDCALSEDEYLELLKHWEAHGGLRMLCIGLPMDQAHAISVLDKDCNGELTAEEFAEGIFRQRGTRADPLSQMLQSEHALRTHQVVTNVAQAQRFVQAATRRGLRRATRRLLRSMRRPGAAGRRMGGPSSPRTTGSDVTKGVPPSLELAAPAALKSLEEAPVALKSFKEAPAALKSLEEAPAALKSLEQASSELRARLWGLRAACREADCADRRLPLPFSTEDLAPPEEHSLAGSKRARCCAGTGSIGGESSGSGSPAQAEDRGGCGASDRSGRCRSPPAASAASAAESSCSAGGGVPGGSRSGGSDGSHSSSGGSGDEGSSGSDGGSLGGGCPGRRGRRDSGSSTGFQGTFDWIRWSTRAHGGPSRRQPPAPRSAAGVLGTLRVQVLGVHGVRSCGEAPFAGSFDTYVVLRVGTLECRTRRACYDLGAAWAFGEARVLDLRQAAAWPPLVLEAAVMKTWLISDEVLGTATVDLNGLEPGLWRRRRRRLSGRQGGELELAVRFEPEPEPEVAIVGSPAGSGDPARIAEAEGLAPEQRPAPDRLQAAGEQPEVAEVAAAP